MKEWVFYQQCYTRSLWTIPKGRAFPTWLIFNKTALEPNFASRLWRWLVNCQFLNFLKSFEYLLLHFVTVVLGLSGNTSSLVWYSLHFICVICHRQIKKTVGRLTDKGDLHLKRINRIKVVFFLHIFIVETHTSQVSVHWNLQSGTHPS